MNGPLKLFKYDILGDGSVVCTTIEIWTLTVEWKIFWELPHSLYLRVFEGPKIPVKGQLF